MAKYVIRTKNKLYNGVTEGVLFQNGQAVVTDEYIKNLLTVNYGYTAEIIEDEKKKAK